MNKYCVLSLLTMMVLSIVSAAADDECLLKHTPEMKEANESFTISGKPINPHAVNALHGWISDPYSNITSLYIRAAQDSNQFYCDETPLRQETGWVSCKDSGGSRYGYKGIGQLRDGSHILQTYESGAGGSGVWDRVLSVKFESGCLRPVLALEASGDAGEPRRQLNMIVLATSSLGDRSHREVQIVDG